MEDIVIIGSGGFAKEVAFLIEEINRKEKRWNILGYIDNEIENSNEKYNVIYNDKWLTNTNNKLNVVFGIGEPILVSKLFNKFRKNKNLFFPNLIHPNVIGDWERIKLGKGNIICASNTLTTNIKIGNCNILNLDCTIGHDTVIGNFNILNPSVNLSGGIKLNNCIMLGTNATLLQYVTICSNVILGASSLVTKDILEEGVYIGIPVKKIK